MASDNTHATINTATLGPSTYVLLNCRTRVQPDDNLNMRLADMQKPEKTYLISAYEPLCRVVLRPLAPWAGTPTQWLCPRKATRHVEAVLSHVVVLHDVWRESKRGHGMVA